MLWAETSRTRTGDGYKVSETNNKQQTPTGKAQTETHDHGGANKDKAQWGHHRRTTQTTTTNNTA